VVVEVGQYVGSASIEGAPELGGFFEGVGDTVAQRVMISVIMVLPRCRSGCASAAIKR
jgi:hypothetical protein